MKQYDTREPLGLEENSASMGLEEKLGIAALVALASLAFSPLAGQQVPQRPTPTRQEQPQTDPITLIATGVVAAYLGYQLRKIHRDMSGSQQYNNPNSYLPREEIVDGIKPRDW